MHTPIDPAGSASPSRLTGRTGGTGTDADTTDPTTIAADAAEALAEATGVPRYDIALVLGSGWAEAADLLGQTVATVDAGDIPGFSVSGVPGHRGTLRAVQVPTPTGTKHALVLGARTHYYEGRGVRAVAHPVRTAAAAGAQTVVLTNGAGGLHREWVPGSAVLINDHLNLTATSPLEGANFVDLTDLYSPRLRAIAHTVDPELPEGVYAQFPGPHYETPAEVQMAKRLGADLVGMSTALEAIAAREAGMQVLGISLVTNLAAGVSPQPLSHAEVIAAGREAGPRISALLSAIVQKILE